MLAPDTQEPNAAPLTPTERADAEERTALRAAVVHEAIREEGEIELERPVAALAWSALAAGLSMGFSLVAEGLLRSHLPEASWQALVAKFGYCIGFIIVVLGRQQLYTENTLTVILPLLTRRDGATLLRVLRLWGVVLTFNLVGAGLFALALAGTEVFPAHTQAGFARIAAEAMAGGPLLIFLRGIFAGWLIAMMVWLLPAAENARLWVIIIMTYLVALGGFSHVIAGSIDTLYGVFSGAASASEYLLGFLLPALLGNTLGGVTLVAVLNHAQVSAERET